MKNSSDSTHQAMSIFQAFDRRERSFFPEEKIDKGIKQSCSEPIEVIQFTQEPKTKQQEPKTKQQKQKQN